MFEGDNPWDDGQDEQRKAQPQPMPGVTQAQQQPPMPGVTQSVSGAVQPDAAAASDNPFAPTPAAAAPAPSGGGSTSNVTSSWLKTSTPASAQPAPDMPQIAPRNPQWGDLYNQLMSRSKQSLAVDANDPIIKGQVDAASVIGQRQMQNDIQGAAERGGAYATGATGNYARSAQEHFGAQKAQMQSQLMSREVDSRRKEISDALSGMSGLLTAEEQSRLKQEDQALQGRQMQLNSQQNAWENSFKESESARQAAQAAAGLGASNNQAGARLAFDQSNAERNFNQHQEEWRAQQAQQLYDNDYRELYGGGNGS